MENIRFAQTPPSSDSASTTATTDAGPSAPPAPSIHPGKWIFSALIGILFAGLFIFFRLGLNVLLFNALLLTGSFFFLRTDSSFELRRYLILSGSILYLSTAYLRFDQGFFHFFNLLLIFALYGLILSPRLPFNLGIWILESLHGMFGGLAHLLPAFGIFSHLRRAGNRHLLRTLLGILIALCLFSMILPLLMSSDAVFSRMLDGWFNLLGDELYLQFFRLLTAGFVLSYTYGQLVRRNKPLLSVVPRRAYMWDITTTSVTLTCLNLVYALFVFIQVKYLFLGTLLPEGMTYSEYARAGFFQLVAVTLINIATLLLINHLTPPHPILKGLLLLMLVMTVMMGISAFYRMHLYETAYGFTVIRLLVYLFLIGEGIALLPIAIGIFKPDFRYLEWAALSVVALYMIYNLINLDAFVAEANFRQYLHQPATADDAMPLDLYYLASLSRDARPVMERYMEALPEAQQQELQALLADQAAYDDLSTLHWFEWRMTDTY